MNVNMTDSFESTRTLHNAGNFALAAALYQQAIALNPERFKAHNNLGDCHDELGQLDKAELAFRTALALMGTSINPVNFHPPSSSFIF